MSPSILYPSLVYTQEKSETGAYEKQLTGRRLRDEGHPKEALVYFIDVLRTRRRIFTKARLSPGLDVSDAHYNVGTTIMEIIHQNTYEWHKEVRAKDRADSANHLLKAFRIRKERFGEDDPHVKTLWELFKRC